MPSTSAYLALGAVAAVVTWCATWGVRWFAPKVGWMYEPNDRTVHSEPVPDVGGIAMFIGFVVALGAARLVDTFDPLFARNFEPRGVLFAAAVMFAVGLIDDIRDISAPAKVAGTVVVGAILVWFGVTMFRFRLPFVGTWFISEEWLPLITVLWVLGMTQAINLIDGLDGLAAGIVAIGGFSFFLYSLKLDDLGYLTPPNIGPMIAIITVGICFGFLPHNFNPARIFMGDGGALLLGLLLAVSTSVVGGRADPETQRVPGQTFFFLAPLLIPLFILGVPIFDTLFAIVRRARRGTGVATADKGHLHHRLMEMGHGQRRTVLILWGWTALLSVFILYPVLTDTSVAYVPVGALMLGLLLYTVLHPQIRRQRDSSDAVAAEPESAGRT
jgi:UDP-GlcNAc:undecaprenyl-phosphate/decaprenyl-phosphate GlcNAc-1-phosphate transferase